MSDSCIACGNDDGHYKICLDCLEKIPCVCEEKND